MRLDVGDHLHLNLESVFQWPSLQHPYVSDYGRCLGMMQMCAILSDGTVVPCCLDSRGDAALGNIPKDLSVYTEESVANLNAAKDAVVRDLDITKQAEVDKMAEAIQNAIEALQLKKADYSKVDAALGNIPKDLSIYTKESVAKLEEAKEAVVRDLDITKQAEVDKMAEAIQKAIDNLKKKANVQSTPDNKPNNSVTTGDGTMILLMIMLVVVSGGTILIADKKRRRNS